MSKQREDYYLPSARVLEFRLDAGCLATSSDFHLGGGGSFSEENETIIDSGSY
ncbi:MAG: hypothetical protein KBS55_00805 [Bacteroidales bacterium]|nr:hypothetical protein [Candidatus Cryptobacteroides aphodequi]